MSIDREAGPLKWNLNTMLAVAGFTLTLLVQIIGGAVLWTNQTRDIKDLNNQVAAINTRFANEGAERKDRLKSFSDTQLQMQTQIAAIPPLTYQLTNAVQATAENKEGIKQTNARIDRVVETFGGKLDTVLDSVNKLAASVAVLTDQSQRERSQRTSFENPVLRTR